MSIIKKSPSKYVHSTGMLQQLDQYLQAKAEKSTVVVGISGDKILDTAKDVAYYAGLPVDIIPTVASTDSPCSSLSVIYQDNGEFDRYLFWTAVRIWCWWTQM